MRSIFLFALLSMVSCAGLRHGINLDLQAPRVVAVLPVTGDLSEFDREIVREMLRRRLATRQVRVVENDWVDRRLVAHGLLVNVEDFDPAILEPQEVCKALSVDGYVAGFDFAEGRLDLLLYFRRSFAGRLEWWDENGKKRWWVDHSRSKSGGLLVQSGQVFKAFRDTNGRGAPAGFTRNVEAWMDESLGTLPEWPLRSSSVGSEPAVESFAVDVSESGGRVDVRVVADAGAVLSFDLDEAKGIPMSEVSAGDYRGSYLRVPGSSMPGVPKLESVRIRDRFGREMRRDV